MTRAVTTTEFRASDGVGLTLYIHHPVGVEGPAPVALTMNPYTTVAGGDFVIQEVVDAGYVFVIMDVRGTGCSGGEFLGPLSAREIEDGVELVEWLADQKFCDGRVALVGPSYSGANQLLVAARRPRGLRCIAPTVAPIDFYRDWTHRGGIPGNHNWAAWTFAGTPNQPDRSRQRALDFYTACLMASTDGPIFWERSPGRVLDRIEVPVLFTGGLHDFFRGSLLRAYETVPSAKRLIVGPWGHGAGDPVELVAWLDRWMRDADPQTEIAPTARWWVLGRDEWIEIEGVDAVGLETLVLPDDLTVRADSPAIAPPPLPTSDDFDAGTGTGLHLWPERQRVSLTPDFHGVVRGSPVAQVRLRVDGWTDADVEIRLSLVAEDGTLRQLTEGRLRLSQRERDVSRSETDAVGRLRRVEHTFLNPTPVSPGVDYSVEIELLPTCFELPAGATVMVGFAVSPVGGLMAHEGHVSILAGSAIHLPIDGAA